MRFSLKSSFFLATLLQGCAHDQTKIIDTAHQEKTPKRSLEELERAEFKDQNNSYLRIEIAQERWCMGERGIAFDDWSWIAQNGPQELVLKAKGYLEKSKDPSSNLDRELGCRENR